MRHQSNFELRFKKASAPTVLYLSLQGAVAGMGLALSLIGGASLLAQQWGEPDTPKKLEDLLGGATWLGGILGSSMSLFLIWLKQK